ncbi:DEAD/DEAH box helicase [Fulvimarina sp. MAC3]|uniref:DEAD/DEAH box helicase n=1 Tax=Fulvimarina sp. MAC3 TaxID=3148887 RepID=UPI0031FD994F
MANFVYDITETHLSLGVEERRLFSRKPISVSEWTALNSSIGQVSRSLSRLEDAGKISIDGERYVLPFQTICELSQAQAEAIGLPSVATVSATLSFEGKMTDPDGKIRVRWYDAADNVVRPKRTGCFITIGTKTYRLSQPLYALSEAINAYNSGEGCEPEERIRRWAPVQSALKQSFGRDVASDDVYLKSLSIYQAGAFALDVRETANGPDFVPVVMGTQKKAIEEEQAGDEETDAIVDVVADALLPEALQKRFADDLFSNESRTRSGYVLDRNTYLVVEPELKRALDVVREKRRAPVEERRAFLRNPKPSIAEAIGLGYENVPSSLFVETSQYSERVLGLGLWKPPAIPWLQNKAGQWLPETFPLKIGNRDVLMNERRFLALKKAYETAEASKDVTVAFEDTEHAVDDVRQALEPYLPAFDDEPQTPNQPTSPIIEPLDDVSVDRDVLLISQNLEGVDFEISWPKRKLVADDAFPHPHLTRSVPKDHQTEGFAWLVEAWRMGWPGVLLADDMGLGKTFQALAFLAWLRDARAKAGLQDGTKRQPILVVAPTALLRNWADESERHLVDGVLGKRVDAFGSKLSKLKRSKASDVAPEDALDVRVLREADWILTTYETLANYHRAFARLSYSVAIFDEAQKIKAPGSINTQTAKAMNVDFVLALTGTPIENRLSDLWCIMDRIVPGYLGDLKSFAKRYEEGGAEDRAELRQKLEPPKPGAPAVLLRRMKTDILTGLPEKRVETTRIDMPAEQAEAYEKAVALARTGGSNMNAMLKAIHAFRGISLHPNASDAFDTYDKASVRGWFDQSARMSHAVTCLEAIRDRGEKALIFLEDRKVQTTIASALATYFGLDREPPIINGTVPGDKRLQIVDAFQASPPGFDCLILSPKAAGVGLTITAANHVIHLSRWWNPAVEDQCNDRAYRIGQDKDVTIHIPVAVHASFGEASFDVTLDQLLERKRSLSRDMLIPPVEDGDVGNLFAASVREAA